MGHWLSRIPDGDLLGVMVNGLSIIVAILLAGWLGPMLQKRAASRDSKERTLRILLQTWQTPANPEYQSALAVAALDFHAVKPVMDAWSEYIAHVSVRPSSQDEMEPLLARAKELQISLIRAMCSELEYEFPDDFFATNAYMSQGFLDREIMVLKVMDSWPKIADGINQSNLIALGLHPAQQPMPPEISPKQTNS